MIIIFSYIGNMDKDKLRSEVLSRYNKIAQSPIDVSLFYNNSVPHLTSSKYISITHTNISKDRRIEFVAIGDLPVGIDVENKNRQVNINVAKRFFTQRENEYINGDKSRFLEVWQKKEAYGKSQGIGIYKGDVLDFDDFKNFEVIEGYNLVLYTKEDDILFVAM